MLLGYQENPISKTSLLVAISFIPLSSCSRNESCPTWLYHSEEGWCTCGSSLLNVILCNNETQGISILSPFCLTSNHFVSVYSYDFKRYKCSGNLLSNFVTYLTAAYLYSTHSFSHHSHGVSYISGLSTLTHGSACVSDLYLTRNPKSYYPEHKGYKALIFFNLITSIY